MLEHLDVTDVRELVVKVVAGETANWQKKVSEHEPFSSPSSGKRESSLVDPGLLHLELSRTTRDVHMVSRTRLSYIVRRSSQSQELKYVRSVNFLTENARTLRRVTVRVVEGRVGFDI